MKVMRRFVDILQTWNFRLCGVFLLDSHFMVDGATFLSGTMAALSGNLFFSEFSLRFPVFLLCENFSHLF